MAFDGKLLSGVTVLMAVVEALAVHLRSIAKSNIAATLANSRCSNSGVTSPAATAALQRSNNATDFRAPMYRDI
jgi:hypothetical protein